MPVSTMSQWWVGRSFRSIREVLRGSMVDGNANKRPKSNWAQITSAWVAVIAILGIAWQAYAIRKNFNESAARQVYMSYSEDALRHPELVEPDLAKLKISPTNYVLYKSFVAHMLFAYD